MNAQSFIKEKQTRQDSELLFSYLVFVYNGIYHNIKYVQIREEKALGRIYSSFPVLKQQLKFSNKGERENIFQKSLMQHSGITAKCLLVSNDTLSGTKLSLLNSLSFINFECDVSV